MLQPQSLCQHALTSVSALLAAGLLSGCLAFAASDQPTPGERVSVQPPKTGASHPANQPTLEQRGTEVAPLFVKSIPSLENEAEAAHKAYERHEKPALDRRLTIGTELLAFFTCLLFCFTAALWMATQKLVKDANKSAERQLRAYLNVTNVYAVWSADVDDRNRPVTINVDFKNSGQTPAHAVTCWMRTESSAAEPAIFGRPPIEHPDCVGVEGPGQKNHISAIRRLVTDEFDEVDEVQVWQRGEKALYVWGQIDYVDAFDVRRWTKFRFVMPREGAGEAGGKFRSCGSGNEAE